MVVDYLLIIPKLIVVYHLVCSSNILVLDVLLYSNSISSRLMAVVTMSFADSFRVSESDG